MANEEGAAANRTRPAASGGKALGDHSVGAAPESGSGEGAGNFNDQQRQARQSNQAAAENNTSEGDGGVMDKLKSKLSLSGGGQKITAQLLQWSWRFYIPSFTLTSIYIYFHIFCRYLLQLKVFCPMSEGSPLAGMGEVAQVAGAGSQFAKLSGGKGSGMERVSDIMWILLGLASGAPLILLIILISSLVYFVEHPFESIGCGVRALPALWPGGAGWVEEFLQCLLTKG